MTANIIDIADMRFDGQQYKLHKDNLKKSK